MPVSVVEGNPYSGDVDRWLNTAGLAAHTDANANPDEAATALTTAKKSGIPPEVINLDTATFAAELKAKQNADLVKGSPALTNYVNTVPLASKVSNDDFGNLDVLHKKLLQIERAGTALSEQRSGFGTVGNEAARGFELGAGSEQLGFLAGASHDTGIAKNTVSTLRSNLSMLDSQEGTDLTSKIARTAGSGVGSLVTDFLYGGIPGFVAGGPVGAIIGTGAASGLASYGRSLDELDQEEQKTGTKIPEAAKQLGAGVIGVATGALNSIGLSKPAAAIVTSAVRQGVMNALPRIMLDIGKSAALGAGINGVLQATHDTVIDAVKDFSGTKEPTIFDSTEKQTELINNIAKAMIEGAAYMGAFHIFGIGSNAITDGMAIRRADQAAAQHKAAMDAADATETKGRSPEALRQFIEIAKRDKTVSIPAAKIDELNMADTLRPLVSNFDEQMNLGRDSGGDVTIPYSAYLSGIEGSVDATLAKDLRHDPEGLTVNEAAELKDQIAALSSMKEPIGETAPIPEPPSEPTTFSKQVSDTTAKELYLNPLFPKPEDVGMTKEQFARYSRLIEQRHTAENKAALDAQIHEVARRESIEWKNNEQHLREELAVELDQSPEWAAHDFVTKRTLGGKEIPDNVPTKLDRATVERLTSEPLPKGSTVRKGVDPEEIADLFGFRSGKELVDALAGLERDRGDRSMGQHRKVVIEDAVQARMEAQFGKFDENIEAEARATAYEHNVQEALHMEMQALGKEIGAPPFKLDALKDRVKKEVEKLPVKEMRNVKALNVKVGMEGRRAEMALLKGKRDPVAAFKAKQKQLIAHLVASEGERFHREAGKAIKRFDRLRKRASFKSIDQQYLNQIHGLLSQFGLGVKRTPKELSETLAQRPLMSFLQEESDKGYDVIVSPLLLGTKVPLEKATVEQFRALDNAVKSLNSIGRDLKKIMVDKEKRDLAEVKSEVIDQIRKTSLRYKKRSTGRIKESRDTVQQVFSHFTQFEGMLMDIDRNDPSGIMDRVFRPMIAGKDKFNDLTVEAGKHLPEYSVKSSRETVPNDIFIDPKTIDESRGLHGKPYELSRGDAMIIGLYAGSKSGMERLAGGYKLDPAQIRDWLNTTLRAEDWKWVQGMWDFFKWQWPMIKEKAIRMTGVAPDEIEGTPTTNQHGTFTGGYMPIMYDPFSKHVLSIDRQNSDKIYESSTPSKSSMKSRVDGMSDQLQIKDAFARLSNEIKKDFHDLAMDEPLKDFKKIILDSDVRQEIRKRFGPGPDGEITPFINYVTNQYNINNKAMPAAQRILGGTRRNLSIATLTYNLGIMLSPNLGNIASTVTKLGSRPADTVHWILHSPEAIKFINDNSNELRHWDRAWSREAGETLAAMEGDSRWKAEVIKYGYHLAAMTERGLGYIQWFANYRDAVQKGISQDEAVYLADKSLREDFHRADVLSITQAMRQDEAWRLTTLFYGYGSLVFNRVHRINSLVQTGAAKLGESDMVGARRDFAKAFALTMSHIIIPAAIFGPIYMGAKKVEDSWLKYASKLLLGQIGTMIPLGGRDIMAKALQGYDPHPGPIVSLGLGMWHGTQDIVRALGLSDKPVSKTWLKNAIQTGGATFGIPSSGPASREIPFVWHWWDGTDPPHTLGDVVRGLQTGTTKGPR